MAPTEILRKTTQRPPKVATPRRRRPVEGAAREILIRAGRAVIRARLLDTPTAARVWRTLPIYSTAEVWGRAVLFETHVETGREAGAKTTIEVGEIAFQCEDDRAVIAYGATPISRAGEIRLASPCNVWAIAVDPVSQLAAVRPGQSITVTALA
jgi:hypothetical protein